MSHEKSVMVGNATMAAFWDGVGKGVRGLAAGGQGNGQLF